MRIAHISDLHVLDLTGVPYRRFLNKRLAGGINLLSFRRNAHPTDILVALVDHLVQRSYDHVVITGDVSNLALESELERAHRELQRIGGPERLTVIPGNHDNYTFGAQREHRFERTFGPYMTPDGGPEVEYPFVKRSGPVTFVGMDTTYWTMPFMSFGRVGKAQGRRLVSRCRRSDVADSFKVVLLHHNMHRRHGLSEAMSRLRDRDRLAGWLFEGDVDLVLHGHSHRSHRYNLTRGDRRIPVIGCGSSTWAHAEHMARYNVYTIEDGALQEIHCHVFGAESGAFHDEPIPLTVE